MMSVTEPESPLLKTPEWLEVLEKRKRPHKLAHEIGAGAACLVCKDRCKGLNLHFWRKLCIECKCRKEDHEIQEEEEDYAQFEILLGAKKVKRTTLKFDKQNKLFDWIPPNVAPDLAIDYLKSIPESKLPISNSEGARYRKQQLEKQVPLHDVDPSACFNLSDREMKEFQKYLDNLKNNVIGQGKILKYQSPIMLAGNYIQDTLQNVMTKSEGYAKKKPEGSEKVGLLTIDPIQRYSAFSCLQTKATPADYQLLETPQLINSAALSSQLLRSQPSDRFENENSTSQNPFSKPDLNFSPKPFHPSYNIWQEGDSKTDLAGIHMHHQDILNLKTPSSFINNNLSVPDKQNNNVQSDNNSDVNINFGNAVVDFLSLDSTGKEHNLNKPCFSQDPYNASFYKDPISNFKELNISVSEAPFIPVQKSKSAHMPSRKVKEEFVTEFKEFPNAFPNPPATCQQCLEILYPEEVVIQAERGGGSALWHAKCFVCETCQELLVDLTYFYHKGKVYCGRHYAEIMEIPRCYGCDELIFVKEYTIAERQSYHVRHFCCFHCDEPLGGKQYIPKDSFPVCLDCYQIKYGKNCQTCRLPIGASEQRVSWRNLDFHVSPECFQCTQCKKSLLGGKFIVKNSNIFCSKECVRMTFKF